MKKIKITFALLDQVVVSAYNFGIAICLTQWLGLEKYGAFALMWLVVLFCSSVHQQCIIAPMQTYGGLQDKQERQDFYGQLLYQQLIFASLAWVGSWAFIQVSGDWFGIDMLALDWLLPSVVFLYLMCDYFRKRFIVLQQTWKAFLYDLVVYGSLFALIYFKMHIRQQESFEVLLRSITQGLSIGVSFGIYFHEYLVWDAPALKKQVVKHMKHYKWLLGTSLTQWFSGNWYVMMAGIVLGPAAMGAIRVAQTILGVFHIPFLAIENFLPTQLMNYYLKNGLVKMRQQLNGILLIGGAMMGLCMLALTFFASDVIKLIYGEGFQNCQEVVKGFCVLYLFVFAGTIIRIYLRTVEKTQYIFVGYVLNVIFAFLLAESFINSWGVNGAVIGLVLSQIIMLAVMAIPVIRKEVNKAILTHQNSLVPSSVQN